jgi:hypothetical protein
MGNFDELPRKQRDLLNYRVLTIPETPCVSVTEIAREAAE